MREKEVGNSAGEAQLRRSNCLFVAYFFFLQDILFPVAPVAEGADRFRIHMSS
jgi:hypothetical protein